MKASPFGYYSSNSIRLLLVKQHQTIPFIEVYKNKENTVTVLLFQKGSIDHEPTRLSDSEINIKQKF